MSLPISVSTSYRQPESSHIIIIPEVLSLIFLQSYYASHNYRFGTIRSREAPLIFLQICKRWSAVALATPELWSSLGYKLSHVGEKSNRDAVMINQWLARAKACPLWLKLRTSSDFDQSSHPVLETFIFHSRRWRHVDFALPPSVFPALNAVKGSLPLLRTLEFTLPDFFSIDAPRLDAFGGASSLRSLALLQNTIRPRMVEIPWLQLTQCSICVDTEGLDIFHCLYNIAKLTLTFNLDATLPQSHFEPPTRLPFLRTLSITCLRMSNPASFWNGLIVPSLSDINFRRNAGQTNSWAPEIYPFISHWASTIRRLTLCNAHLADDELVRCIREITLLEKLEIDEEGRSDYVSNDFMRLLQFDPDSSPCLAPKLQYIGFKGFYYLFDDNVFMDMVASRWRPLIGLWLMQLIKCLA